MTRTVAFLNQKGGVGKTSTVHHLGGTLARRGLKVLVVDADPQASLTQGLLGPDVAEDLDPRETIAAILDDTVRRQGPRPGASDRLREPLAPGRLRGRPALQSARSLGFRPAPVLPPRRPGRSRRRLRHRADRLPATHPALGLVSAGRRRRRGGPTPGRGLRGPGPEGDTPEHRAACRPKRTRGLH